MPIFTCESGDRRETIVSIPGKVKIAYARFVGAGVDGEYESLADDSPITAFGDQGDPVGHGDELDRGGGGESVPIAEFLRNHDAPGGVDRRFRLHSGIVGHEDLPFHHG